MSSGVRHFASRAADWKTSQNLADDVQPTGLANVGPVLEKYRQYLLAIAMAELPARLAGKVGASDIVQESILKGCQNYGSFQGSSPEQLAAWLRAILLNHLANVTKAYSTGMREVTREQPADSRIAASGQLSPSQELVSRELRDQLNAALNRLPAEWRQVFTWRHQENLSFAEIGLRLGKSEDTARRAWARAIRTMQRELQLNESRAESRSIQQVTCLLAIADWR